MLDFTSHIDLLCCKRFNTDTAFRLALGRLYLQLSGNYKFWKQNDQHRIKVFEQTSNRKQLRSVAALVWCYVSYATINERRFLNRNRYVSLMRKVHLLSILFCQENRFIHWGELSDKFPNKRPLLYNALPKRPQPLRSGVTDSSQFCFIVFLLPCASHLLTTYYHFSSVYEHRRLISHIRNLCWLGFGTLYFQFITALDIDVIFVHILLSGPSRLRYVSRNIKREAARGQIAFYIFGLVPGLV